MSTAHLISLAFLLVLAPGAPSQAPTGALSRREPAAAPAATADPTPQEDPQSVQGSAPAAGVLLLTGLVVVGVGYLVRRRPLRAAAMVAAPGVAPEAPVAPDAGIPAHGAPAAEVANTPAPSTQAPSTQAPITEANGTPRAPQPARITATSSAGHEDRNPNWPRGIGPRALTDAS